MERYRPFCLEVWGEYACFTRPELKVERVSYDVPTPSAVRGIFEAILWKPAIRWQVVRIEVLNPIRWASMRRNEVKSRASERSRGIFIEEDRSQRASIVLRDVRYRFYAALEYIPPDKRSQHPHPSISLPEPDEDTAGAESPGKYLAMFERRARKGQCFMQPYLGCREFAGYFRFIDNPAADTATPIDETRDLGLMLYDIDFSQPDPVPLFFRARMERGVIEVPPYDSPEILR